MRGCRLQTCRERCSWQRDGGEVVDGVELVVWWWRRGEWPGPHLAILVELAAAALTAPTPSRTTKRRHCSSGVLEDLHRFLAAVAEAGGFVRRLHVQPRVRTPRTGVP